MRFRSTFSLSVLSVVFFLPRTSLAEEAALPMLQNPDAASVSITPEPIPEVLHQAQWGTLQFIAPQVHPVDLLSDEEVQQELRALHQIADVLRIPMDWRFPNNPKRLMSRPPVGSAVFSSLPPGEYFVPLGREDLRYLAAVVSQSLFTANQGDPLIGLSTIQRQRLQEEIDKILLSVPSMAKRYNEMKRIGELYRNRPNTQNW